MGDYAGGIRTAVCHFGRTRRLQSRKQGSKTGQDRGSRRAVTGGKQMDGFVQLVHDVLEFRESACLPVRQWNFPAGSGQKRSGI